MSARESGTQDLRSALAATIEAVPPADPPLTPLDSAAAAVARCLELLGADVGFVAAAAGDGRTLTVARVTQYSQYPTHLSFPLDAPYPLAEAIRTRRPLYIDDNEQLRCEHPGLVRVKSDDHACATLPLADEAGLPLGAINIGFEDPRSFGDEDREAFAYVAERCAALIASSRR